MILATGAIRDAALDIPGIDLPGSYGAADFVAWFDGHPDVPREWPLDAAEVAVIGNGNVALDVARVLAKHAVDLRSTEIARQRAGGARGLRRHRRARLRAPRPRRHQVHADRAARARRGARRRHRRRTTRTSPTLDSPRGSEQPAQGHAAHLTGWRDARARPARAAGCTCTSTTRRSRCSATTASRACGSSAPSRSATDGVVRGTGELRDIPVQAVYRAVGYYGTPVVDAPFDAGAA